MIPPEDRHSLIAIIACERASVAFYAAKLKEHATPAQKTRYKALRAYHKAQIKRRQEELKQ